MDDTTILCEECGYDLSSTPEASPCPECARPSARSRPNAREGSPWQRKPGLFSWVQTNVWMLWRHGSLFERLRVEPRRATPLLLLNLWLAGAVLADPWVGVFVGDPARGVHDFTAPLNVLRYGASWLVWGACVGLVLLALTWVEYLGVRFFAARRGWRLTSAGAWQVCAHASVGWIVCAALPLVALFVLQALIRVFHMPIHGTIDLGPRSPVVYSLADVVMIGVPVVGGFVGLLVFEFLVYKGVRAVRYAARVG